MFITRKHLTRRTLLKGAGVALALPLLDAMIPAATALAQTAAARKLRMGFFYFPHGAIMNNTIHGPQMDRWMPSGAGSDFKLNVITNSLEPYKNYVTSFGNLKNDTVGTTQHVRNPGTWLSAMSPDDAAAKTAFVTLDQVIAPRIAADTPFPSLEIASETNVQQRSGGVQNPYTSLSFRDLTTPNPMEYNPRALFVRLFGKADDPAKRAQTVSLLDLINEQTQNLQRDLGPADRATLDEYLTSVREVEKRLPLSRTTKDIAVPPMPNGVLDKFDEQVTMMFDILEVAYRADLTRVATFLMAAEGTNQTYNHIGVPDSYHPVSHHANDLGRIEKLVKIQTWHAERFANFVGKLAAIRDGEGTLLDNSIFLYGSNMSNSDRHSMNPLPTLLVGGGAGKLRGSRHIELPQPTPIANLHMALLEKAGIERPSFGNSTGTIAL